jgi:hypothetical protein
VSSLCRCQHRRIKMANSTTAEDDKHIPGSEEGHEECLHGADAGIEGLKW